MLKVHVHTDDPAEVLAYATALGEVAEVHINNMRRQTAERAQVIAAEQAAVATHAAPRKPFGFVAVAAGDGLAADPREPRRGRRRQRRADDEPVDGRAARGRARRQRRDRSSSCRTTATSSWPRSRCRLAGGHARRRRAHDVGPAGVLGAAGVRRRGGPGHERRSDDRRPRPAFAPARSRLRSRTRRARSGTIKTGQLIGIADHEIEVVGARRRRRRARSCSTSSPTAARR